MAAAPAGARRARTRGRAKERAYDRNRTRRQEEVRQFRARYETSQESVLESTAAETLYRNTGAERRFISSFPPLRTSRKLQQLRIPGVFDAEPCSVNLVAATDTNEK